MMNLLKPNIREDRRRCGTEARHLVVPGLYQKEDIRESAYFWPGRALQEDQSVPFSSRQAAFLYQSMKPRLFRKRSARAKASSWVAGSGFGQSASGTPGGVKRWPNPS